MYRLSLVKRGVLINPLYYNYYNIEIIYSLYTFIKNNYTSCSDFDKIYLSIKNGKLNAIKWCIPCK